MNFVNLLYALPIEKLHALASGAIVLALILATVVWRVIFVRRRRERPLALVVADAIAAGSVHASSGPDEPDMRQNEDMRHGRPQHASSTGFGSSQVGLSRYEALSGGDWGFSLHQRGTVIATFVYPGVEEARAAHKAMRRALRGMAYAFQPASAAQPNRMPEPAATLQSESEETDFRPERVWV